ncbi:MAG TPA: glycosyltransferase [Chthoniobacterales bacterium]|nr:glycosyltransferase [Chthoniobacterales bacterium]
MRQNKLLLVSPCQGTYGGIEAFVLAVADAVQREPDFAVKICFKKVRGFHLHPDFASMLKGQPVIFVDRAGKELADAVRWADIVHLQNASPDVVFLARLFGKRIVLTIHNYMPRQLNGHRLLWRISARFADARWYNSNFVWRTWEGEHPRRGSRKVPTTSRLPEGTVPINERRGFVFVGRWIANKGIETLVEAYARADLDRSAWPLVLIGDGPLRPAIDELVRRHALDIAMPGFVDDAVKADYMRKARWVVVPPHTNEDLGLTALEARNLGVPCIITRDGGLPEAGGKQSLMCEPRNPDALARLLEQAARMSMEEYAERAEATRRELAEEMVPLGFYADSYRRIIHGESLG